LINGINPQPIFLCVNAISTTEAQSTQRKGKKMRVLRPSDLCALCGKN